MQVLQAGDTRFPYLVRVVPYVAILWQQPTSNVQRPPRQPYTLHRAKAFVPFVVPP